MRAQHGQRRLALVLRFTPPLFALALLAACERGESEEEERIAAAIPKRVQPNGAVKVSDADRKALGLVVEPATAGALAASVLRYGRVSARTGEEAVVASPVTGRIARPPSVSLGSDVPAGAVLVEVVPVLATGERLSFGVQGAELAGQSETLEREIAAREAEVARARDLAQSKIVSAAKLLEAETALSTARARLQATRNAREVHARGEGKPLALRAPVAGALVSLNAAVGALVQSGDVVARVLRKGPRWVDLAVPPDDPSAETYEVVGDGGKPIAARLVARGAVVSDDGARHDRLEIAPEAAAAVLPGAVVAVRVARQATTGIVLPETAVVSAAERELVFVESSPGLLAPRPVRVAARWGNRVRLETGVKAGERIVVRGAMALRGEALRSELSADDD